jgi:phosphomannomutase
MAQRAQDTIRFGTDGWRGLIGEDFNFANVRRVAAAVAGYVRAEEDPKRGIVIGYDTRFLSPESAECVAAEIAAAGIPVTLADHFTPTPAVSYAVVERGAAGGIMITASHNPSRWNGVKFKASYGGSGSPAIMQSIERHLRKLGRAKAPPRKTMGAKIQRADLIGPYLDRLKGLVRLEQIKASGFRFVIDPMYGAAMGCLARLFEEAGIGFREIHGERNPIFPGLNPEPIEPHVAELRRAVTQEGFDAGFATDGDADRLGAIDLTGAFIDSHRIFSILLKHLVEDLGLRGEVVKTFSTTRLIDKLARKHRLPLHITPIGFKYVSELMLERDILIGGEESGGIAIRGHLPERDGVLNSLFLAEVMADRKKTLGELTQELEAEFGPHCYERMDLEIEKETAHGIVGQVGRGKFKKIAGFKVTGVDDLDGVKLLLGESAWLLVRASGTENLLRLYAEAPSKQQVRGLLDEIAAYARRGA